ncbi:hypothetical protein EV182_002259 [Spiromyces aspiralis]|uniref:Uncharacterized protein n=1 Tax=Spiromyces aspiralis TaxID=68401 RepID=A0ACC1HU95_9FUNG|nr:hypothetical protein EV182_002259 [Spiromyces aspiralis]
MGFTPSFGSESLGDTKPEWVPTARQDGKVILVTGASRGIGYGTAETLAALGAHVIMAGNDPEPMFEEAMDCIVASTGCRRDQLEYMGLDLGDLSSVRKTVEDWKGRHGGRVIDVLINNAGIPGRAGTTKDGWELCWGINYLGTVLFTRLMLPHIKRDGGRIVFVSSSAHAFTLGVPLSESYLRQPGGGFFSLRYGESKLAVLMFGQELARRLEKGINTYVVHPGTTGSSFWSSFPEFVQNLIKSVSQTPQQGARTSVYCATEPDLTKDTGKYYADCAVATPSFWAGNADKSKALWDKTCSCLDLDSEKLF